MKFAAVALLCVVAFGSVQAFSSARRSLLEDLPEVQLYAQCGGKGVACNTTGGVGQCKDQAWTTVKCPKRAVCDRQSDHYWMCQPGAPAPAPAKMSASSKKDEAVKGDDGVWTLPAWKQCGGSEGDCSKYGSAADACIDCPFPNSRCEEGYVCNRVVEYFWQCAPSKDNGEAALTCEGRDSAAAPAFAPAGSSEAASRTCEAAQNGYAVQGKRFKAVTMATADSNYEDCCASCTSESSCVAFHLNNKSDTETVCALFSEFNDVVAIDRAVAGLMSGAATNIAG